MLNVFRKIVSSVNISPFNNVSRSTSGLFSQAWNLMPRPASSRPVSFEPVGDWHSPLANSATSLRQLTKSVQRFNWVVTHTSQSSTTHMQATLNQWMQTHSENVSTVNRVGHRRKLLFWWRRKRLATV